MNWNFGQALDGNIAVMGEIDVASNREFTIAIALGDGHHSAARRHDADPLHPLRAALASASSSSGTAPTRPSASPPSPPTAAASCASATTSSSPTKTRPTPAPSSPPPPSPGAPPSPTTTSAATTSSGPATWCQSATALLACGRTDTARRALVYLACTQHPDGGFAQNFWIDGTPYWSGIQLDEVAFPIILAWRLWKVDGLGSFDVFPFVERAAAFLVRYAPVTQQERWEENAGYSPSTLAAVISALVCAADIARAHESHELGRLPRGLRRLDRSPPRRVDHHHRRRPPSRRQVPLHAHPPAGSEASPSTTTHIPPGTIHIANRGPDEKYDFEAREVIDGGFLELVRYGIRRADDPLIVDSLKVVDRVLKIETPYGPCWRRYNHDGYGQRKDGGPYDRLGTRPRLAHPHRRTRPLRARRRPRRQPLHHRPRALQLHRRHAARAGLGLRRPARRRHVLRPLRRLRAAPRLGPRRVPQAPPLRRRRPRLRPHLRRRGALRRPRTTSAPSPASMEIFQTGRPITRDSCRPAPSASWTPTAFRVVWTTDNWATTTHIDSTSSATPAPSPTSPTTANQTGTIIFTLYWPARRPLARQKLSQSL